MLVALFWVNIIRHRYKPQSNCSIFS